jgi:hypothetical protein
VDDRDRKSNSAWRDVGEFLLELPFTDEMGLALFALIVVGWILVMIVRAIIHDASSGGSGFQGLGLM